MTDVLVVLQPRAGVAELIDACARGTLPFSGPDSLHTKMHALGYRSNGLYEMVLAREAEIASEPQQ